MEIEHAPYSGPLAYNEKLTITSVNSVACMDYRIAAVLPR
jgi:hypothetical protein